MNNNVTHSHSIRWLPHGSRDTSSTSLAADFGESFTHFIFFFVTKIFKKIPRARKCTSITNGPWIPADIHQVLKCSKILQRHKQNLRRWSLRSCCRSGSRHCTGPGAAFSASFLTADRRLRESVARVAAHIVSHSALAADCRNKFKCAERVATLSRKLTDKLNSLSHENIHRNS